MNNLYKAIRVLTGIATFWAVYWFLIRNQIVAEFVRPQVDSGQLGVASANVITSAIEILAAVGTVVIAALTKFLDYVSNSIEPFVRNLTGGNVGDETTTNDLNDPKRLTDDLSRLLIQSVIEGNRSLTIQLAHRLAKREFLEMSEEDRE